MINFWNIRRKFATNSSSSHSMIVVNDQKTLDKINDVSEDYENEFGWNNFTLKTDDDKKRYLHALFKNSLERDCGVLAAQEVLKDLGLVGPNTDYDKSSVDHQSVVYLPLSEDGATTCTQFAQEFSDWVLRPDVVILGGNDNEDPHPDTNKGMQIAVSAWLSHENIRAFKDESLNAWSLYSSKNGLTLRFSFDDMKKVKKEIEEDRRPSERKSSRPNLVDVKITDMCPYQCSYCYQGSTPKGNHAPLSRIYDIVQSLKKEQVFEVALGGGEPTLHPDFEAIVDLFFDAGITPNFTTRNLSYLRNAQNDKTLSKIGGFAISVDNLEGAQKTVDVLKSKTFHSPSVQLVVGAQPEEEFKAIVDLMMKNNISMTYLGFKTTGFGAAFLDDQQQQVEHAQENWLNWVKDIHENNQGSWRRALWIVVDTALAQVCDEQLKNLDPKQHMYHRTEGTTSMYIDAVENTLAPSSFCDNIYTLNENWLETYRSFDSSVSKKKKISLKLK